MPNRRKGAPGSFGAPLHQLLPKFGQVRGGIPSKVDVHRAPEDPGEPSTNACRIFMLNQQLYEGAKK